MTGRPTAATGAFPYPHRTVAEVDADSSPIDIARRSLAVRKTMPTRPEEWCRSFGITPGQAIKLIRDEERKRK